MADSLEVQIAKAEDEVRRRRNLMSSSTYHGRRHTAEAEAELDKLREMRGAPCSPLPWRVRREEGPNGTSVAILDSNGAVVALMKAAGGNKLCNAALIVERVNG